MPMQSGKDHHQYKHGMFGTRPYGIWVGMKSRCYNKKNEKYKNYGGRGIKVCERWHDYQKFWADMKEGYGYDLSLDRIDNDGDYEPSNCRWATLREQASNRSDNIFYTYKGKKQPVSYIADQLGIKRSTVFYRIKQGWSIEDALFTPLKGYGMDRNISYDKSREQYQVSLKRDGKMVYVGRYKTIEEARKARNEHPLFTQRGAG